MAKKLKKNDDQLADAVRMSSQEIWQAGLAAFAKAQEEEGKFFSMQLFEERVLRALSSIGVPTREEVAALNQRIDALSKQVEALGGKPVKPAKADKADKAGKAGKADKPAKSAKPVNPAQSAKPAKSAQQAKPAKPAKSAKPAAAKPAVKKAAASKPAAKKPK